MALNLMDEAERHGIHVDVRHLARELGVPVIPMVARRGEGIQELLNAIAQVASGQYVTRPHRIRQQDPELEAVLTRLIATIEAEFPDLPNARWVALRLLDGDASIEQAIRDKTLGNLTRNGHPTFTKDPALEVVAVVSEDILNTAAQLREKLGTDYHDKVMEAIYTDASQIADSSTSHDAKAARLTS